MDENTRNKLEELIPQLFVLTGVPSSDQVAIELEAALTRSAFGHEYTLMHLNEFTPYSKRQEILHQLEEFKNAYFYARERLLEMNPEKLGAIEEDLRFQKDTVLRNNVTLH